MEEPVEKQYTEETVEQAMQQEGIRRAITDCPAISGCAEPGFFQRLSHSQIADVA